jgi:hypothetical protein
VSVRLERRYPSRREAERVGRSVAADNPEFVVTKVLGNRLTIDVSGGSPASVRMTLDDLIACLGAAEKAGEAAGPEVRPERPEKAGPGAGKRK